MVIEAASQFEAVSYIEANSIIEPVLDIEFSKDETQGEVSLWSDFAFY